MKKSFTLIEIIVAVIIVMIATFSIISLSNNTKHLFSLITKQNLFGLKSTIVLHNHSGKNLYEDLIDFKIENDDIIKTLKQEKITYKQLKGDKKEITSLHLSQQISKIIIFDKYNRITLYKVDLK